MKTLFRTIIILLIVASLFCSSCAPNANQTDHGSDAESETSSSSPPDGSNQQKTDAETGEVEPFPSTARLLSRGHVMIIEWGSVTSRVRIKDQFQFITDFMEVECRVIKTYDGTFEDSPVPSGSIALIVPESFEGNIRYGAEALVLTEYFSRLPLQENDGTTVEKDAYALIPDYSFPQKENYDIPFILNVFYIENRTVRINSDQMFSFYNGKFYFPEAGNAFPVNPESGYELPYMQNTLALMFEIRLSLYSKGIVVPEFRDGITLEEFDGLMDAALTEA